MRFRQSSDTSLIARSLSSMRDADDGPENSLLLSVLRHSAAEKFDASQHSGLLSLLKERAFSPVSAHDVGWSALGFQGDDPATDLRGAGLLGLRHLLHFMASGRGVVILRENERCIRDRASFPLAMASLNVTHMLCSHLRLLERPSPQVPLCSRTTLSQFARLSLACPSALSLIQAELLSALAERWRVLGRSYPKLNLMHFPEQLDAVRLAMIRVLARLPEHYPWSLPSVLMAVRRAGTAHTHTGRRPRPRSGLKHGAQSRSVVAVACSRFADA